VFFKTTATFLIWQNTYSQAFYRHVEPLIRKHFPGLIYNKKYSHLYDKIYNEGFLNYLYIKKTFAMFNSDIDDALNVYFDVAHPIYDVLFDDPLFSDFNKEENINRITKIVSRDYNFENKTPLERLLIDVLENIDQRLPASNKAAFYQVLRKLHFDQVDSIKQHDKNLSNEELRSIEFRKGGNSMVLYVLLNERSYSQEELDAYFIMGAFLQSVDDFSDMEEDTEQGIETLAIRKLIVPEEQWLIRDIFMGQLFSFVDKYQYDYDEVSTFHDLVDKLMTMSAEKYQDSMDAISERKSP